MKIAVIGGGVAGVSLAIQLADFYDVTIFEKNDRILKKLLVTGNGQCNFSNEKIDHTNFHGDDEFINKFFSEIDIRSGEKFLSFLGIEKKADKRGRIYPSSMQASSVVDAFFLKIEESNVELKLSTEVEDLKVKNNKFIINNDYSNPFNYCILAPGSMSYPQLGTDGKSYKLAENLGHKKTKLYPGITAFKASIPFIRELKGTRVECSVFYYLNSEKIDKIGDIIFTEDGISGNAIFEISSNVIRNNIKSVYLDFMPDYDDKKMKELLIKRIKTFPNRNTSWLLNGIIHKKIGNVILKVLQIDKNKPLSQICDSEIEMLTNIIKSFEIRDISGGSWKLSQITIGGIDTNYINTNFESKIVKNLFMIGEYLNVDGDCGGYNITFALLSSIKVADFLKEEICKS